MRRSVSGQFDTKRRMLFVILTTSAVLPGTGCSPAQLQQVLTALQQAARSPSSPAPGALDLTALVRTTQGVPPGASRSGTGGGYGPLGSNRTGALPRTRDGSTRIPNHGPNPSRAQVGEMLAAAARKHGIPEDLLKAVAWQESRWDPRASSFDGGHGKGVMQIDDRHHAFARTPDVWDPVKNIDYGARFLRQLYDRTGSWRTALRRYNGGASYPPIVEAHARNRPWTRAA